jgi:ribosome biogenesis GTPase
VESGQLSAERYEGYLKLDDEIAELKLRLKNRKMTNERRNKRDHRVKARNLADRVELENELDPRTGTSFSHLDED